jgi:beta-alanine--pyruvate transaminase
MERERGYHCMGFAASRSAGRSRTARTFSCTCRGWTTCAIPATLRETTFHVACPHTGRSLPTTSNASVRSTTPRPSRRGSWSRWRGRPASCCPPVGYLQRLRDICTRHGILLIFDEVITAFGRLGVVTASGLWGVKPDILTMAKGLTNAAVPMGAAALSDAIYQSAMNHAKAPIKLFHGYADSGHPLAAAAALATLDFTATRGCSSGPPTLLPQFVSEGEVREIFGTVSSGIQNHVWRWATSIGAECGAVLRLRLPTPDVFQLASSDGT